MKSMTDSAMFVLLVLALMFSATKEEQLTLSLPGTCPDYRAVALEGLSQKVQGLWYGTYFMSNGYEDDVQCFTSVVIPKPNDCVQLVNTFIKTGKTDIIFCVPIHGDQAKYTKTKDGVDLSGLPNIRTTSTILLGDSRLVVEYICATDGINHRYKVIVYSRQPTVDDDVIKRVKAVLKAAHIYGELEETEDCEDK